MEHPSGVKGYVNLCSNELYMALTRSSSVETHLSIVFSRFLRLSVLSTNLRELSLISRCSASICYPIWKAWTLVLLFDLQWSSFVLCSLPLESVLKILFCFAGLPNPASSEAFFLFLGLDSPAPASGAGVAIQASGKQISKRFLTDP